MALSGVLGHIYTKYTMTNIHYYKFKLNSMKQCTMQHLFIYYLFIPSVVLVAAPPWRRGRVDLHVGDWTASICSSVHLNNLFLILVFMSQNALEYIRQMISHVSCWMVCSAVLRTSTSLGLFVESKRSQGQGQTKQLTTKFWGFFVPVKTTW